MRQLDPDFNAWLETFAYASECSPAKPSYEPRAFDSRGLTGPISIVPGWPRERSRLILRARPQKIFAFAQQLLTRFGNPCDVVFRSLGISPIHTMMQVGQQMLTTKHKAMQTT